MTRGLLGVACSGRVNFGVAYTGLATVAYKLVSAAGATLQDWTTTSVTEDPSGSGIYRINWSSTFFTTTLSLSAPQVGGIQWRTASSGGVYAVDDLDIAYAADATVASRSSQTSVDTIAGYVDTEVAAIKAKTDLIPAAGPADAADYTSARAAKLDKLVGDTPTIRDAE